MRRVSPTLSYTSNMGHRRSAKFLAPSQRIPSGDPAHLVGQAEQWTDRGHLEQGRETRVVLEIVDRADPEEVPGR